MKRLNLDDFFAEKPKIKYCAAKKVIKISETSPKKLYSDFNFFVKFLDGDNNVLRWTAIIILGNLAKVDSKNKIDKIIPRLIKNIDDKSMITAGNSIKALGKIGIYKPKYQSQILKGVLKVEKANYYNKGRLSHECRNVAIGHSLDAILEFDQELIKNRKVFDFIKRQTKNTRPSVQRRANKLLKKL